MLIRILEDVIKLKKESNHPAGHNCPTDQHFEDKKGKCVNNSEAETVSSDSSARNKSASNLRFKKVKKISGTSEVNVKSNIDTNQSLQANADAMQTKVQDVDKRIQNEPTSVQDREVVGIKTKSFKRQDLGKGSTNL